MDPVIEKYMRVAIAEAFIARAAGENPFGAVLLEPEGNFCHKAHSRSIELNDPTAHAEILAIREYCAEKKIGLSERLHPHLLRGTLRYVFRCH